MSSKTKIVEAARELFYRNGFLATSVDEIIGQAGVSKSNFYYHFKSKEDLGIAVLDQRGADLDSVLDRTLRSRALSPEQRLNAFFDTLLEIQESRLEKGGCPFGNLVAEMTEHSERFRCRLSAMFDGLSAEMADLVAEGQRGGAFRRDLDPADVAALIVQTTQGMQLMTKCHKTVKEFGRSARLLVRLIGAAGQDDRPQKSPMSDI